jgi:hypothetical protein
MGVEDSLCHILNRELRRHNDQGLLTLGPIAEVEVTAHVAAQAKPEAKIAIARMTAVLVSEKILQIREAQNLPLDLPLRVKWTHLRHYLDKMSDWSGYPVPKPR